MNIKVDINVCRVCLKSDQGIEIFSDDILLEKFQYTTMLKISKNDGLPALFCDRCVARLKIAFDFRRLSIISDSQMRAFISKVNNEFKQVAYSTSNSLKDLYVVKDEEIELLLRDGFKTQQSQEQEITHQEEHNGNEGTTTFHQHYIIPDTIDVIEENTCITEQFTSTKDDDLTKTIHIENSEDNQDQERQNDESEEFCKYIQEDEIDDNYIAEDSEEIHLDENEEEQKHDEEEYDDHVVKRQEILLMTNEQMQGNLQDITLSGPLHLTEKNQKIKTEFIAQYEGSDVNTLQEEHLKNLKLNKKESVQILASCISSNNGITSNDIKNENRTHICIKCDKDFSTKTNLMRHMLTHDGIKPYQCNICGNGFTQNGSLKSHMLIHTGQRPFRCEVCGRGFTQSKSLIFHMRRHTGEKPFSCISCGLNFRQKDGLKRHIQIKHSGTQSESHKCTICSRILHSKYSLAMHMQKHLNRQEMVFKCNECNKSFQTKAGFDIHMRQHYDKPFKCEKCNKGFAKKATIAAHMKTHEEKPLKNNDNSSSKIYQCGKCFKSFSIKRNLLQHFRNHNTESIDLYKCEECSIAFNTKRGLKLHRYHDHKEVVSDLNECDICSIPFVSVHDLNQHMINVHDTINEKCPICLINFTSKKLYEDHVLEHEIYTIT